MPEYKPKLSIELTQAQADALRDIALPWGWQRAFFSRIVDELIALDQDLGPRAIALIISGTISVSDAFPTLNEARRCSDER